MERKDGRACDMPRAHKITVDFVKTAAGSCLIETGGTRVICTASVEEGVPPFLKGKNCGWLTAEYAMLPASTGRRKQRDGIKKDGRGVEISRLIGRALRQAVDRERLGERTVTIDCDVLEADGGTRTAAITGMRHRSADRRGQAQGIAHRASDRRRQRRRGGGRALPGSVLYRGQRG